jgi:hypothetical protein
MKPEEVLLNPCECGGQAIVMNFDNKEWAVECIDCWFYSNRKFKSKEKAISYWNNGAKSGYMLMDKSEAK